MIRKSTHSHSTGFTIVELLIVVVVIAILAAITIVAYNGIVKRTSDANAQSALSTVQKKVAQYYIENNDTYPVLLEDAGLTTTNSTVSYQYTANNSTDPKGYCASVKVNNSTFHFANQFTPLGAGSPENTATSTAGLCAGHIQSGTTITNYVPNSGVGANLTGFSGPNSSTLLRDTTKGAENSPSSVRVTMPANASNTTVGLMFYNMSDVSTLLTPGMTYTVSAWVWVPSSTVNMRLSIQGAGKTQLGNLPTRISSGKDQWVRIYDTFVANTSGQIIFYVLNDTVTPASSTDFWADSFMINQSNVPATYANGNTPGWVWNGTVDNSSSTGPAV